VNDKTALLAAIVAQPDDDTVRLAFADWLDEHDDPDRAAFIRLQIREPHLENYAERQNVERETHRLFHANSERWLAGLPKWLGADLYDFKRGFFTTLTAAPAKVTRIPKRVWARHPIQELTLREPSGQLDRVLALPQLNRIRDLFVHADWNGTDLRPSDLKALANCPNLTGVRSLSFHTEVGSALVKALARCPSLRELNSLSLHDDALEAEALAVLTETGATNLRQLKMLFLESHRLNADAARVLARAPALAVLETLFVWRQGGSNDVVIGDEGVAALARSSHLSNLRSLWLYRQGVGPAGARALAKTQYLTGLRKLSLSGNPVGADGVRALLNGPWPELTSLQFKLCDLHDDVAGAFAKPVRLPALTALDLSSNEIGDDGARVLSRSPGLKGLVALDLSENEIGNEGARALCESTALPNLRLLRVRPRSSGLSKTVESALKARFGESVNFPLFH
jgi:uncharacterized protein (TIGR02996 family)